MSDELVNIEINGIPLRARKGAMIIEVTDTAGIHVPRFCYHRKLSIAANCRMCLVEVERAPKPLPACATPVMDGMKVYTASAKALAAQKATMEFLLINHPLDCPICDQGGECELQDVAMGYGEDVSRYSESKRVVKDKDIGPLISTDMTRCIHCTRCVRFGEEIAGVQELGATGRGEFMEIGTYVAKAVTSELSGNVIDLCPVGALNAKPSRMTARAWEMIQHATIAPHDCVGSNIYLHTLRGRAVRVVPRDNDLLNESWISDRDRFSYQGLYSDDRLDQPMVKRQGVWREVDWDSALNEVVARLSRVDPANVGALVAPHATVEELYLVQKLARGVGVHHIDHRLRQCDFRDQQQAPLFPWLGQSIEALEDLDALLLVGSNIRKEQPIIAHRLRKATLKGAGVMTINPCDFEFYFPVTEKIVVPPMAMVDALAGIAAAALHQTSKASPKSLEKILADAPVREVHRAMANRLAKAANAGVFLGALAINHPALSELRALAGFLAESTKARLGYIPEAANSAGAWLAGVLPHRLAGGQSIISAGRDVKSMLQSSLKAYLLFGVEPEFDCDNPSLARRAMEAAEHVVVCAPFASDTTRAYADILLPIAAFTETSGTFVNAEGRWQSFSGASHLSGQTRPGWKVLRVLGNRFGLEGFEYLSSEQVRDELKALFKEELEFDNSVKLAASYAKPASDSGLMRGAEVPIYALDALVRRSKSLQQTTQARPAAVYIHPQQAESLALTDAESVQVRQGEAQVNLPLRIDVRVAPGCAWIPSGLTETSALGTAMGPVELTRT
jgi:NADH-quinone oxidoreductase subunit G